MAAVTATREQAIQSVEQVEADIQGLPERWLPRAGELRDFAVRWLEAWNSHDLDALEAMVTEDITWEDPAQFGETVHGRAEFRAFTQDFFRGLPDVRFEPTGPPYVPLEGDGVAVTWRMTGTFTGDLAFWGKRYGANPPAWAPTGRSVDIEGVDLYEFRDGLLSKWTIVYDLFGLSRQLGLVPPADSRITPIMVRAQRLMAALKRRGRRQGGTDT
jgi:steroid delta-isomerase-like uncharacterized protein